MPNSELFLNFHLNGGKILSPNFLDIKGNGKKKEFDVISHHWRIVKPGLNFKGICKNPKCKCYQKEVIINKGSILYNLVSGNQICRCPECLKRIFDFTSIIFYYCYYFIAGLKHKKQQSYYVRIDKSTFDVEK